MFGNSFIPSQADSFTASTQQVAGYDSVAASEGLAHLAGRKAKTRRRIGFKSSRESLTKGWHPIGQRPTRNRVNIPSHPPGVIGPIALHTSRFGNPVGSNKQIRRRALFASELHHFECLGETMSYRPNSDLVPGVQ